MTPSILSVVTPAASYDLTVLATVKDELGITGTAEDDKLERWIRGASSAIAAYLKRVLAQETVRETFRLRTGSQWACHWACEPVLLLKRYPIASIASVTEDGTVLDADQYEVEPESGSLYRLCNDERRDWTAAKVVVQYAGGFVLLPELPDAIERACISLVKHYRANATRDTAVTRRDVPGVLSETFWVGTVPGTNGDMPADVVSLIEPYRNITF